MSAAQSDPDAQGSLFEVEATRTLLDPCSRIPVSTTRARTARRCSISSCGCAISRRSAASGWIWIALRKISKKVRPFLSMCVTAETALPIFPPLHYICGSRQLDALIRIKSSLSIAAAALWERPPEIGRQDDKEGLQATPMDNGWHSRSQHSRSSEDSRPEGCARPQKDRGRYSAHQIGQNHHCIASEISDDAYVLVKGIRKVICRDALGAVWKKRVHKLPALLGISTHFSSITIFSLCLWPQAAMRP
jgi:hypothetical protein